MPRYTFTCRCGYCDENVVTSIADRDNPRRCPKCREHMVREFPVEAGKGFQPFAPYYDEVLNIDITGRRMKQYELKARGLIEAGDTVHGARNFDKHAPEHIKPLPPRGITHTWHEEQRKLGEQAEKEFKIGVTGTDGKARMLRAIDLPNAKK